MKIAICLSGAMSKLGDRFLTPNALYNNNPYIDFRICFNSTKKHIIDANPDCTFDFFIHSWNEDLQNDLESLYKPRKALFENQTIYNEEIFKRSKLEIDFGGISKSLSLQKSIQLMENNQSEYDLVMIYRTDILLLKNIDFKLYDPQKIYVNTFMNCQGDFHFIMNAANAKTFKNLYNSLDHGNRYGTHFWIKNYVINFMNKTLVEDGIVAGIDQEVLRKISIGVNTIISPEVLSQYGSTQ